MNKIKIMLTNLFQNKALMMRATLLIYALINQFLVMKGYSPLPFTEAELEEGITMLITIVATALIAYKDTPLSNEAVEANQYMKQQKAERKNKGGHK
ncbi:phage holin [Corticicoccus populi]|uniref:Phage holin n=1 Tax=Corticicoccus populi TaxID=1812821 RepID=A0ABW5WVI1_9STAP